MFARIALIIATFLLAWVATGLIRRYALQRQMLDVPNARSSHTQPTARGGGVAIVLAFLGAFAVWHLGFGGGDSTLFLALVPGGVAIAILGFWDDHCSLPAKWRFLVHLLASAWAVYCLGGWPMLDLGFVVLPWGVCGSLIALLLIAWAINLYNFMDGIDGLAGMEAVFVGLAGASLLGLGGRDVMPAVLLAGAAAGFLVMNWPPAKIFMGDAGSGFLGYAFAVLALHATVSTQTSIWPWLILLGVFVCDATLTLIRRAVKGVRVTDAHRTHAYQWASRRAGSHRPVTLTILGINVLLWLLAVLAVKVPVLSLPLAVCSVVTLLGLAWKFDAGVPERPPETVEQLISDGTH
jgi:Fuc2NAc and GlcNAc transferase